MSMTQVLMPHLPICAPCPCSHWLPAKSGDAHVRAAVGRASCGRTPAYRMGCRRRWHYASFMTNLGSGASITTKPSDQSGEPESPEAYLLALEAPKRAALLSHAVERSVWKKQPLSRRNGLRRWSVS